MTAPDPTPTIRDQRRRQRQVSAYLSELRAAHGREASRLRRALRPRRARSRPPAPGDGAARPA